MNKINFLFFCLITLWMVLCTFFLYQEESTVRDYQTWHSDYIAQANECIHVEQKYIEQLQLNSKSK